jgi:hypothetical protein
MVSAINSLERAAGGPYFPCDRRHTAAPVLLSRGVRQNIVSVLGNSRTAVTLDLFRHVTILTIGGHTRSIRDSSG